MKVYVCVVGGGQTVYPDCWRRGCGRAAGGHISCHAGLEYDKHGGFPRQESLACRSIMEAAIGRHRAGQRSHELLLSGDVTRGGRGAARRQEEREGVGGGGSG